MQVQQETHTSDLIAREPNVHLAADEYMQLRAGTAYDTTNNSRETVNTRDRSPFYAQAQKPPLHGHLRVMTSTSKVKARAHQQESTPHNEQHLSEAQHMRKLSGGDADQEDGFLSCYDEPASDINTERYTLPEVTYL